MKSWLIMMVMLCVSVTGYSQTECVDGIFYYFNTYDKTAAVTYDPSVDIWSGGIETYQGDLEIPETVKYNDETYTVTSISSYAFRNNQGLTSISIPKTVTYLDESESAGMTTLYNLTSISVAADNQAFKAVDGVLYNKAVTRIYCVPAKRGGIYAIPATVTAVDNCIGRPHLDELIIPATVTRLCSDFVVSYNDNTGAKLEKLTIEDSNNELSVGKAQSISFGFDNNGTYISYAPLFAYSGMQELYLGRNLKFSDKYSSPFAENDGLSKVVIGSKVTKIPDYSFLGCRSVQTVDVKGGLSQWCGFDFSGKYSSPFSRSEISEDKRTLLFNGTGLTGNVTIPSGITAIPSHAFQYGVANVTSISLHANVTDIADGAFRGLAKLQNIYLDANNTSFKVQNGILYDKNITKIVLYPRLKEGAYTVPSTVTAIGDYIFSGCTKLTEITIPVSVLSIGKKAFDGCSSLNKLVMEDSATPITWPGGYFPLGNFAVKDIYIGRNINVTSSNDYETHFFGSSLDHVGMGSKVTRMPANLFYYTEVAKVDFDGTIIDWCNITFENEYATPFGYVMMATPILYLKGQPLHSQVNIPSGAKKIGAYSFYGQRAVTNVTVPTTVTTIEPYAFSGVNDVYLNVNGLLSLENANSFSGNVYITDSYLPQYRTASVWSTFSDRIYPLGFLTVTVDLVAMSSSPALLPALNALEKVNDEYRISALTNLKIRGTMNGWDVLMIRNKMPNLRYLDLSEATILTNDGGYEYYQGYHTEEHTITPYMFYEISNLRNVILPADVTSIGYNAFAKSGITDMTIPGTVKTIGDYAFENCQNLKTLTLSKGLERIGYQAFGQCNQLAHLTFPTTLKEIQSYAFAWCQNLSTIDFAEGLQYIGDYAFYSCQNLKNLHMPTSLRRIGSYAFNQCYGLTQVHVPSMVTEIGDYAFKECGLKAVYAYTLTPVQINQNTFDYKGVDLYAPDNSFYAYYLNTQWSQFQDVKEFEAMYTNWYTPRNTDIEINVQCPIKYEGEDASDGSMEPGSGLIFVGDGEQLVKKLIMNWQHGTNYPSLIENGNLNTDELSFIMNVYPGRWYFFSFPFDVKLQDISLSGNGKFVWRYYDADARAANGTGGSWKNVTDGILKANVGYIFQSSYAGDLELPVGNPDYTKQVQPLDNGEDGKRVALENHNSDSKEDAGWNFVGNPNLSYYNIDDMNKDFTAPITVWNDEQQTYEAVVPGDDDYELHPFQAFFVQKGEQADNLDFYQDKRETYQQAEKNNAKRAARRANRAIDVNRLLVNVELSNGSTTDKTRIVFDDSKAIDYEPGCDAVKFMSHVDVPQIYSLDVKNVKYAVNNRPNGSHEVRLGVTVAADGEYTIDIPRMDFLMCLKDNVTGITHDFSTGAYTFEAKAGADDSRFTLVPSSTTTAIAENAIRGLDIVGENGAISVNGIGDQPVNIYNTAGVRVAKLNASGRAELTAGTYIVALGNKVSKVLVK